MALTRDAADVHEERVTAAEESRVWCDACGRQIAEADSIPWDASGNHEAQPFSDPKDVVSICRCCRDGGGVGRCDNCGRLVPAEDLMHIEISFGVPEGVCREC